MLSRTRKLSNLVKRNNAQQSKKIKLKKNKLKLKHSYLANKKYSNAKEYVLLTSKYKGSW